MGFVDLFRSKPTYKFTDFIEVEQRTLKQLGLHLKYAVAEKYWPLVENGKVKVSKSSYPFTETIAGDFTVEKLYHKTPAFQAHYATPMAMLKALLEAK